MASRLGIMNMALVELGEDEIQFEESFEDLASLPGNIGTPIDDVGTMALRTYDTIRDAFLQASAWSWLTERRALVRTAATTQPGWRFPYEFTKPAVSNIRGVYDARDTNFRASIPRTVGWDIIGDYLYAIFEQGYIEVQRDVVEEAMPAIAVNALVLALAERWAGPVTEDESIIAIYRRKAVEALRDAKRVDSQSRPARGITDFPYVSARLGGVSGRRSRSGLAVPNALGQT